MRSQKGYPTPLALGRSHIIVIQSLRREPSFIRFASKVEWFLLHRTPATTQTVKLRYTVYYKKISLKGTKGAVCSVWITKILVEHGFQQKGTKGAAYFTHQMSPVTAPNVPCNRTKCPLLPHQMSLSAYNTITLK